MQFFRPVVSIDPERLPTEHQGWTLRLLVRRRRQGYSSIRFQCNGTLPTREERSGATATHADGPSSLTFGRSARRPFYTAIGDSRCTLRTDRGIIRIPTDDEAGRRGRIAQLAARTNRRGRR
jgi:hypothetical protein